MLVLYILVGTGVVVWLWLVWDLAREARSKPGRRSAEPLPAGPGATEDSAPEERPRSKAAPKAKPAARRPRQKVSYTRHRRKPPPKPAPEPESERQPPARPARDPREWMDEDYD